MKQQTDRDLYLCRMMASVIQEKLKRTAYLYRQRFPHVSRGYQYAAEENRYWTSGFYPGMMYLAYDLTGDSAFLMYSEDYLDSFEARLNSRVHMTHDLGFLYTLSSGACFQLTGEERAGLLAERAADLLAERYHENGGFIQAWGEIGAGNDPVRIIIDTMMNLPLLYRSGRDDYRAIAQAHAMTSARTLIREDGTSFHTYWMDPVSGRPVRGATHQGFRDQSTWARGQAWAVYGYAISYAHTKEPVFLETARKTAEVFMENLPGNSVPYWDFSFTDQTPDIRDTSAAAIFLCGILELRRWEDEETAERYDKAADRLLRTLFDHYFDHNPDRAGVLREGMYHRNDGANEFTVWGDYFFFEALVRMLKDWEPFW